MGNLRLKFELHALKFEAEGDQDVVKEEFKNFNENILTRVLAKVSIVSNPQREIKEYPQSLPIQAQINQNSSDFHEFPTLNDVKVRDLPQSEPEWVLIYCFYASEFGTKEFSRENILNLYEQNERKTDNRRKNISHNLASVISSLYVKSTNDTHLIVLPKGKEKAIEILTGKSEPHQNQPNRAKQKSRINPVVKKDSEIDLGKIKAKSRQSIAFRDLNLSIFQMNSLKEFFSSKSPKGQNDEVAVVLSWYQENVDSVGATLPEINYLIKIATTKVPSALAQVLINMKGPKLNLLLKDGSGKYALTSLGVLHVTNNLPR